LPRHFQIAHWTSSTSGAQPFRELAPSQFLILQLPSTILSLDTRLCLLSLPWAIPITAKTAFLGGITLSEVTCITCTFSSRRAWIGSVTYAFVTDCSHLLSW